MVDCDIYESENWLGTGNASTPGNAEVPDNAKARAGAMVMMPVKRSTNEHEWQSEGRTRQTLPHYTIYHSFLFMCYM